MRAVLHVKSSTELIEMLGCQLAVDDDKTCNLISLQLTQPIHTSFTKYTSL
jgi:hypothetical protein